MDKSISEKLRRKEVLNFAFESYIPFLRRVQGAKFCTPQLRKSLIGFIDVIKRKEKYERDTYLLPKFILFFNI